MTGQEKCDLLIQVTARAGFTVFTLGETQNTRDSPFYLCLRSLPIKWNWFQYTTEKIQKVATSIPVTHKYMTTHCQV